MISARHKMNLDYALVVWHRPLMTKYHIVNAVLGLQVHVGKVMY